MSAEASTVLKAVAADFLFNCWYLEISSDNRIHHISRCVHCHAQGFRLETFELKWAVIFTPRPIFLRVRISWFHLNRKGLLGSQKLSRHLGEQKNMSPLPGMKPLFLFYLTLSLITISTELIKIVHRNRKKVKWKKWIIAAWRLQSAVHICFPGFRCLWLCCLLLHYIASLVTTAKWPSALTTQCRPPMRAYCWNVPTSDFTFTLPNETQILPWPLANNIREAIALAVCDCNLRSWELSSCAFTLCFIISLFQRFSLPSAFINKKSSEELIIRFSLIRPGPLRKPFVLIILSV
jgi:hypothetical protein